MEHYSVVLAQKTAQKKRKMVDESSWKLRLYGIDEDSDDQMDYIAALTNQATYARWLGFGEPFAEFVSHLDDVIVQERLNRSLPVSLWIHLLQPLLKLALND